MLGEMVLVQNDNRTTQRHNNERATSDEAAEPGRTGIIIIIIRR